MKVRVLTTMVADCTHIGHVNHVLASRKLAEEVSGSEVHMIVGIHSDEVVASYKRQPLFSMEERMALMKVSPGVDEIMPNAPLDLTLMFLDENEIDFVCGNLAEGNSEEAKRYNAQYEEIINAARFISTPRTNGISTSEIFRRMRLRLTGAGSRMDRYIFLASPDAGQRRRS